MKYVEVPVSGGYVAIVDAVDADLVLAHKWNALSTKGKLYAQRSVRRDDGEWATEKLHSYITGYALTDHRNGDGLDNRRENLRRATQQQNMCNRIATPGKSGFKGVTWNKRDENWKAQIGSRGKHYHLGYYLIAEEAAMAYDEAARRLHGEFATLNFPNTGERAGRIKKES